MSDGFDARRARAKRPCPLWVDAFLRDTQHLEADEVGAYFLILMAMWTHPDCSFPDDDRKLARVCRVSPRLWKSRIGPSLRAFFSTENGVLISKRLREEAAYIEATCQAQSDRKRGTYAKPEGTQLHSQESAEKSSKPLKNNDPEQTADISGGEPRHYPTQQPNNPIESKANALDTDAREGELIPLLQQDPPEIEAARLWNEAADRLEVRKGRTIWAQASPKNKQHVSAIKARLKECDGLDGWRHFLACASTHPFWTNPKGGPPFSVLNLTRANHFATIMDQGETDERSHDHGDVELALRMLRG